MQKRVAGTATPVQPQAKGQEQPENRPTLPILEPSKLQELQDKMIFPASCAMPLSPTHTLDKIFSFKKKQRLLANTSSKGETQGVEVGYRKPNPLQMETLQGGNAVVTRTYLQISRWNLFLEDKSPALRMFYFKKLSKRA